MPGSRLSKKWNNFELLPNVANVVFEKYATPVLLPLLQRQGKQMAFQITFVVTQKLLFIIWNLPIKNVTQKRLHFKKEIQPFYSISHIHHFIHNEYIPFA